MAATLTTMGVLVASTGLVMLVAPAASAHTPDHSASCAGVTAKGTSYESKDTNTLTVTVGSATETKTFDRDGELTVPVPQDGTEYAWTAQVHTTNSNSGYSKSWSGKVGPCGHKSVSAPGKPYPTGPTCDAAGSLTIPAVAHVEWWVGGSKISAPKTFGPGDYAVEATPESGYKFDSGDPDTRSWSITVRPKGDGKDCRTVVAPVAPTVDQAVCTGPGQSTSPKVNTAGGPAGVTYSVAGAVVTATIDDSTHRWGTMPPGWTKASDTEATYTVTFTDPGDCAEGMTPPPAPQPTPPTCTKDGSFTLPADTHKVDWSIAPAYHGVGSYTVTATAKPGYRFNSGNPDTRTFSVEVKAASQDVLCAPVPAEPEVTPPSCAADGSYTLPTDTDEVDWSITPTYAGPGDYEVEAATVNGYKFADDTTVKTWDITVQPQVTGLVCYGQVDKPGMAMTPPSCTDPGQLYLQPAGDHVVWTVNGTDTPGDEYFGPGTYDVSASTVGAFKFPDGTTTADLGSTKVAGKKKGDDCVLGTESSSPKPHKSPTVKGTSAAVPTAVAAGLPGGPGSTSTGSLLAQLMVGGGLVLLLAGGWAGFGRRSRGVHEV